MADRLSWGLLAAGNIARKFAEGVAHSKTGTVLAVASRDKDKAAGFAGDFDIPRSYGSYEELLADDDVDAVYVSTPHPMHAEWAIKAAEAGKHVLCEKPIGINYAEAMAIVDAAERNDVFLMEAFMYRCHPQTRKLVELIRDGAVGEVRVIQASFSFHAGYNLQGRLLNQALGGGGILDVGCYPVSLSRLVAGVAQGKPFADPVSLTGAAKIGSESRVDEYAVASALFPGNIVASLSTGVQVTQANDVRIFGSEGNIVIPWPWIPSREGGSNRILLTRNGKETEEIVIETSEYLYGIEADTVAANLEKRQAEPPAMTWEDTLGNMRTLDMWRDAIGLVYDREQPQNVTYTMSGGPLRPGSRGAMKYGKIPGVGKKISRVLMGVDHPRTVPYAAALFDDFIECGGNAFDTAYIYGGGTAEKVLGHYVRNRGIRDDVVILDKGAHTPACFPDKLSAQFAESLERLQTDYVDIYMMHRDNPDVPVGEFMDVMNEHAAAGRMKIFGVSNWSKERIDEANAYADGKGLARIAAVSNNFSLARMVDPVWKGCIASSSPDYVKWHTDTRMPLMPWSSQARGFFVEGRSHPDRKDDPELVRCWYAEDNFKRLERARELAEKKGCLPINIALAYVLCQPFPTFPLIGPRKPSETRSSLPALGVELTPKEVAWLNLAD
ncbi:MAG: aldo/keto reductase [Planctomycetes bacterium]|nr:aldo/keto reductase [Planctomycetota bacterium]